MQFERPPVSSDTSVDSIVSSPTRPCDTVASQALSSVSPLPLLLSGAYGAHGLSKLPLPPPSSEAATDAARPLTPEVRKDVWQRAVSYQQLHSVTLLLVPLLTPAQSLTRTIAGASFSTGILCFSGGCYGYGRSWGLCHNSQVQRARGGMMMWSRHDGFVSGFPDSPDWRQACFIRRTFWGHSLHSGLAGAGLCCHEKRWCCLDAQGQMRHAETNSSTKGSWHGELNAIAYESLGLT